ncbi:MAG: sigma 54-interacting transcriptional regulator [Holophaga sp.]|nr:sigma 54-interacting transcriptional regulator [Holophaga sp.]
MKKLVVISGSEVTRKELASQLANLFGNSVEIESHALNNGDTPRIENALVVVASATILERCRNRLAEGCEILIGKRTLNYTYLNKLYAIPEGSSLLIVNGSHTTAIEVTDQLKEIGFVNFSFQAHFPGCEPTSSPFDFIITPGETKLVPFGNASLIDIGPRIFDITTIIEIVNSLGVVNSEIQGKINLISAKYMKTIISLGKELHVKNDFLLKIINSVNDGILSYSSTGEIQLINSIASGLLRMKEGDNIFNESDKKDKKMNAFLKEDSLENYIFQLNNSTYLFSKIVADSSKACLLTIKNVRERINMENQLKVELKRQGYRAKYTFDDLIFKSSSMREIILRGKKLASNEFSILIYGESGTGKEIFASAVHNASKRHMGPFMAVNFSALPDELIESELFGYEEGAFTGAKRGGKVGLFELANQGTLFLDEIGDISPKIQSRLLRVLQEKEILKVGGTKNIPVDVRVVAATNKDLSEMVKQGKFREDLYYRLKKLYIHIPPLRQRRDDILPLFKHFLIKKNGFDLKLTDEARALLTAYDWPGNVREMENNVEFILTVCEGNCIDRSSLSEDLLKEAAVDQAPDSDLVLFILSWIQKFNRQNEMIGRKKLSELSRETRFNLSENQIRRVLGELSARGLVQMSKGKVGLRLTDAGVTHLSRP